MRIFPIFRHFLLGKRNFPLYIIIMEQDPRQALDAIIQERGEDYVSLSKMLGRNAAYIQQYIKRGSPRKLDEDDRAKLAAYLKVPESLLGAPQRESGANDNLVYVRRRNVEAAAGAGALADMEYERDSLSFNRQWLRKLGADPNRLSIINVTGDSMAPLLADGDAILVNEADRFEARREGVYVLRRGDELIVKRVRKSEQPGHVRVTSDNSASPSPGDLALQDLVIIGRVIWTGRAIA